MSSTTNIKKGFIHMKKIFKAVIFLSILSFLLNGCAHSNNIIFSELKIGENFLSSRDGYFKKISDKYCLFVNLRKETSLFEVSKEHSAVEWNSSLCYDNTIVEGHYIKGFFTSSYLILCEENNNNTLVYSIFDFSNAQIRNSLELSEIHQILGIDSIQWFTLCNTNSEIQSIK